MADLWAPSLQETCTGEILPQRWMAVGYCKNVADNVSSDNKILGGVPITSFERPYQVSLQKTEYNFCGGSLISKLHVLTAGHCTKMFSPETPNIFRVMAGYEILNTNNTPTTRQYRQVEYAFAHNDYTGMNTNYSNDIGIIKWGIAKTSTKMFHRPIEFLAVYQLRHLKDHTKCRFSDIMKLRIMAGYELLNTTSNRKQYRQVESAIAHKEFTNDIRNFSNDIGIIKVSEPFDITDTVKLVTLRLKPSKTGELCVVSGWGKTEYANSSSNKLLKLDEPIYDHRKCKDILEKQSSTFLSDSMICAGNSIAGTNACRGDSGGPLTCDNELTGIVSFGPELCGMTTNPDVYTEVYHFEKWIEEHAV
ncbi:trypsin-2-like [Arctopsyche grandis]|uniref:trypsin-2-like n=1 Tax=Arctopsyche grandis TaxID=121162 RepID=UPI00406D68E4